MNTRFLDQVAKGHNCPGFILWDALGTDGETYRVAADYESGVSTRMYMRSNGAIDIVSCVKIGANPACDEWDRMMGFKV